MPDPSPTCQVKDGAGAYVSTSGGVDVTPTNTITIKLADLTGAAYWSIACIGTDELLSAATINASLVIDSNLKTATFTAPAAGSALIFQSTVGVKGIGLDANGKVQASYTTTFGIYTLISSKRVGAINETYEGSGSFGWATKLNPIIRTGGGGGTPGGSSGEVQYNNAGAFGGATNVLAGSGFISFGTNPSTTGALRLGDGGTSGYIYGRNGSTNYFVAGQGSGQVYLGDDGAGVTNLRTGTGTEGNIYVGTGIVAKWGASYFSVGTNPAATGVFRTPNNTGVYFRRSDNGADRWLIGSDGSDNVLVGNASGPTLTRGTSVYAQAGAGGVFQVEVNSVAVAKIGATYLSVGTSPATTGAGRFANNGGLYWRNSANTADFLGLNIDASSSLYVGGTAGAGVWTTQFYAESGNYFSSGAHYFRSYDATTTWLQVNSTAVTANVPVVVSGSNYISIASNPAATGAVRLAHNAGVYSRNSGGSADRRLIGLISDVVEVGSASTTTNTSILGNYVFGTGDQYVVFNAIANDVQFQTNSTLRFSLTNGGNASFFGSGSFGSGVGVVCFTNRTTAPSANPTSSALAYADSGGLIERKSTGVWQAMNGLRVVKNITDANYTATDAEYTANILEITGTLTAGRDVLMPSASGFTWGVFNNTTGGFALTFKVSGQTGIAVAAGKRAILYSNGTDVVRLTADV